MPTATKRPMPGIRPKSVDEIDDVRINKGGNVSDISPFVIMKKIKILYCLISKRL